jgi:hypothetical protein
MAEHDVLDQKGLRQLIQEMFEYKAVTEDMVKEHKQNLDYSR